jgi:hypothetical protein
LTASASAPRDGAAPCEKAATVLVLGYVCALKHNTLPRVTRASNIFCGCCDELWEALLSDTTESVHIKSIMVL